MSSDTDKDGAPKLPLGLHPTLNMALNKLQGSTLGVSKTIRARVFPYDFRVYFICCVSKTDGKRQIGGDVGMCTTDPVDFRPSLCRWSASAADTQSLTMDVADMRVTYDGQTGETRFSEPASTVTTNNLWDRVHSARVELLVTSDDEVRTKSALPSQAVTNSTRDLGQGMDSDRRLYLDFGHFRPSRPVDPASVPSPAGK